MLVLVKKAARNLPAPLEAAGVSSNSFSLQQPLRELAAALAGESSWWTVLATDCPTTVQMSFLLFTASVAAFFVEASRRTTRRRYHAGLAALLIAASAVVLLCPTTELKAGIGSEIELKANRANCTLANRSPSVPQRRHVESFDWVTRD